MRVHASHPQLRKEVEIRSVYVFTCAGCDGDFYVRAANVQADGSLKCWQCGKGSHRWCPQCHQTKPHGEFEYYNHFVMIGRAEWCLECAAAAKEPKEPTVRECGQCGTEFPAKRRDARYCSSRCRVAAHRAASSS